MPASVYEARVLQRGVFWVGILGTWVAFAIGLFVISADFGSVAILFTLAVAGVIVAVAIALFAPTRIEVEPGEIRLVARRATTRYEPSDMGIRRQGHGRFEFVRLTTGRTLARFADPDEARVEQAFTGVGTSRIA